VLWAVTQPAAMAGLVAAYLAAVGLRTFAQGWAARLLGGSRRASPAGFEPLGVIAATFCGTGWGRPVAVPDDRRGRLAVLAGPLAVLVASQAAFAAYRSAYPGGGLTLRLNRPSDVLHGAVAPTAAAQLMVSVAVGLLCFGLLALVPVPPLDGYRLLPFAASAVGDAVERVAVVVLLVLLVVPVSGRPPLVTVLDAVAGPLIRVWS
jgi:Zn-dependent protease